MLISIGPFLRSNIYIATCWIVLNFEEATVAIDGQSVAIPCLVFFSDAKQNLLSKVHSAHGVPMSWLSILPRRLRLLVDKSAILHSSS